MPCRRKVLASLGGLLGAADRPARAAGSISLPHGQSGTSLAFELIDNRVFVDVEVDGRGPWRLVFDSGGSNILDSRVAEQLRLPLRDRFEMPGAGESTLPAWRSTVRQVRVGEVKMHNTSFVVMPLGAIRQAIGFERLDGLVGHELLQRFVVQMDFGRRRLHLHEPGSATLPADTPWLPIDFNGTVPRVPATVDGRPANLAVDTGDRSSLTLFLPYVEDQGLRQAYPRTLRHLTGWGVGGPLLADLTRVDRLMLGDRALRQVLARMPIARRGVFASRAASGSVGTGVLRHLDPVFDYTRRRLWLPTAATAAAPDAVDRSGCWLTRPDEGDGAFAVAHLVPDGPAERAGLAQGDMLVEVDGQATARLSLPALRARLASDPPGTAVGLTLRDGRQRRLVLADLL